MSEGGSKDNLLPPRPERFGWDLPDLKYLEITRDDEDKGEGEDSPDEDKGEGEE